MRRDDNREDPDFRPSTGGTSVLLVLLLVGGAVVFLFAVAGFVGFAFLARSEAQEAEMRMILEEERAMSEHGRAIAERRAVDTTRTYTREEFKMLVNGKTEGEVEEALGKPARIEQDGPTAQWHYEKRTTDRVTGATDPTVRVTFEFGRVTAITIE